VVDSVHHSHGYSVRRYIDLFNFEQLRPEYLVINPRGVVPTLVHNGQPVRECSVINEYIDAAFEGPKLTPSGPLVAARMREFVHACDEVFPSLVKLTMVRYILPKLGAPPGRRTSLPTSA
jgi:glutathione S-transferase